MRILLSILFCVFIANAIAPKGAVVTQSVTINSAYVSETSSHFLLQFKVPRTGLVAANCDSAKHVCMTGVNDTVRVPRWVVFTTDTLFIYADVSKSTSSNTVYNLHYGKTLNEVNSSSTFTNCGIVNYWGFDEFTGTTSADYAGGYTATIQSPSTLGNTSLFVKGYYCPSHSGTGRADVAGNLNLVGDITVSVVINAEEVGGVYGRIISNGDFNLQVNETATSFALKSRSGVTPALSGAIPKLEWLLLTVTRTSSGVTNFYYNTSLSGAANQSSGTPAAGSSQYYIGNTPGLNRSYSGYIDNLAISRDIKTIGYITDKYRSIFTSTFLTLGTPVLNELTGAPAGKWGTYKNLGIDLKLF